MARHKKGTEGAHNVNIQTITSVTRETINRWRPRIFEYKQLYFLNVARKYDIRHKRSHV